MMPARLATGALALTLTLPALATPTASASAPAAHQGAGPRTAAGAADEAGFLVGRGIADITGPAAENGMMGYAKTEQTTSGIWQRLRARTFVVQDQAGHRVAYVVAEMGMDFRSVDEEVQRRLRAAGLADRYGRDNVVISGTHTHAGPGGYSGNVAYNLATNGFQPQLMDAIASGIVESLVAADKDLRPGAVTISRSTLDDGNVNRSKVAFDRNPVGDRAPFPDGRAPESVTLRFSQGGREVGLLNWFAVHATSLPSTNTLLSPDNKGYAAYHVEHDLHGVRYRDQDPQAYVAAFAAGAEGDQSPNLDLRPGSGPTQDPLQNTLILGRRQAAAALAPAPAVPVTGSIDHRKRYVDLGATTVSPRWTGDGRAHTTCRGAVSASMAAGSTEDGPALAGFTEGLVSPIQAVADALRTPVPEEVKTCQHPKASLVATGALGLTPDVVPLQTIRLGQLVIATVPGEISAVAGLRLRRAIAETVGANLPDVILQPYAGDYNDYTVTPEEYDSQQYEGGSTLNGRWQLPAYQQELSEIAAAMQAGRPTPDKARPTDPPFFRADWQTGVVADQAPLGAAFGDVLTQPPAAARPGQTVAAVFVTGHPKNALRRGGTFLEVQRLVDGAWQTVADDGDVSTTYRWQRAGGARSTATVTWQVPADAPAGSYRLVHHGDARSTLGTRTSFTGTSRTVTVG
ncbi:neutral/alkaline non-lysosomal ceramidase N-terminal domain-containing protein [Arsenicicoccus dermatophilus]|uniref:neutral/alkaline non-lysosomal ceramidase N-terminal domain-containing protein n=1 Tax=Arsenicicoccus dermatophilus TaxID=1076331 RepID=UPI001F4CDAED|nr:neutral/alkaline non-lysosomal ceramidase N-terminal domain-containing protein [Arsenicicoccus dermatophilus]MCH8611796.1 neutral/alkaline ceramidase [Arsenicicoccus dermatophilus]